MRKIVCMGRVWVLALALVPLVQGTAERAEAASACSIEVSPLTLELQVAPGRAHTGSVEIRNTGADPQHIKAYCQDWTLRPDGVVVFVPAGRLPNSASGWVLLAPTEFDLAPRASQEVRYTVKPSVEASGEARTVVIFEAEAQQLVLRGARSRVIPRMGTILYVNTGPVPTPQARVVEFSVASKGGVLVVENTGAAHVRFTGRLEIRRSGELVQTSDLKGFVILPAPFNQHRLEWPQDTFADLSAGEYEVTAILDCGGPSLLGARTNLVIEQKSAK